MRFFFYGTLLDPELRAAVIGRAVEVRPAALAGWRRVRAPGKSYPMLVRDPAAAVQGAVTPPLDPAAIARLSAYEGPGYRVALLRPRTPGGRRVLASVFLPVRRVRGGRLWRLEAWRRAHLARYLRHIAAQITGPP
jgi:Gamma-glutamyl cyclotransferase, AIG2-like